jgi:DeoR family fructose operon transcriptional repressor
MNVNERRRQIVDLVKTRGRVDAQELVDLFAVNAETIRRDLSTLEGDGSVHRVHGGAVARDQLAVEGRIASRLYQLPDEKNAIAVAAAEEIPPFGAIFIEAGSTTARLASFLPHRSDLLVVTNALDIALELSDIGSLTVMTVGGRVRPESYAEVDTWALDRLANLRFDVAFVGTNAIDPTWGLSTPDPSEAAVKKAIIDSARRTVLMVDHTKFGMKAACRYSGIDELDLVITDSGADPRIVDDVRGLGTDVRLVDECPTTEASQ